MTYVTSQNPNTNYSNNQNPPSSYLNNQNPTAPPPRVAQAGKKTSRNTEEQLLDLIFPGKMGKVAVKAMRSNPNKLVKSVGYGAWTQSKKLIYYEHRMEEHLKPFILFHEGLHIMQFDNNGGVPPDSFAQMLNFELFTYKESDVWINNALRSKKFYSNATDYKNAKKVSKESLDITNKIFLISAALKIGMVAKRGLNFMLQILSQSTVSTAPNTMTYEEIVFMNMQKATNLPQLVKGKQVYTTNDLYSESTDPKFYEKFGY
jgi:hypothetical protein